MQINIKNVGECSIDHNLNSHLLCWYSHIIIIINQSWTKMVILMVYHNNISCPKVHSSKYYALMQHIYTKETTNVSELEGPHMHADFTSHVEYVCLNFVW